MICEILGVPGADRQQIRHWTDGMLEREVGNPFPTRKGIEGAIAMAGYMDELVRERRAHPTDDMISHLVQAEVEREDGTVERLTDTEVGRFILLLSAAGAETVTKLVGNAVMTFGEHPDELAKLKADPALAGTAVEEVLRYKAPSQYQGRFSVADREFHGETIPAGFPVLDHHRRRQPRPSRLRRPGSLRHRSHRAAARHHLRARDPLLHRGPPGPPRGQDGVQRALPPVAGPPGRPRRHQVRPHGQRRRPLVGAGVGLTQAQRIAQLIEARHASLAAANCR